MRIFNIRTRTKESFIKDVCAKMAQSGYECVLNEDNMLVISTERGSVFAQMWNTPDKGRMRIHFSQEFMPQDMDKLSNEGAAVLVSACNNHMEYTTMQFINGHFSCYVTTFVGSEKDFVREFNFAYKQIGDTVESLLANYPAIMKRYTSPTERRPIGFLAEMYREDESKETKCSEIEK